MVQLFLVIVRELGFAREYLEAAATEARVAYDTTRSWISLVERAIAKAEARRFEDPGCLQMI